MAGPCPGPALLCLLLAAGGARGPAASPRRGGARRRDILLIQSYDQLMTWAADIQRGVVDTLGVDDSRVRLTVENLDSKIHHTPAYFDAYSACWRSSTRDGTSTWC